MSIELIDSLAQENQQINDVAKDVAELFEKHKVSGTVGVNALLRVACAASVHDGAPLDMFFAL